MVIKDPITSSDNRLGCSKNVIADPKSRSPVTIGRIQFLPAGCHELQRISLPEHRTWFHLHERIGTSAGVVRASVMLEANSVIDRQPAAQTPGVLRESGELVLAILTIEIRLLRGAPYYCRCEG